MRPEYLAIHDAGMVLQIDAPDLAIDVLASVQTRGAPHLAGHPDLTTFEATVTAAQRAFVYISALNWSVAGASVRISPIWANAGAATTDGPGWGGVSSMRPRLQWWDL